MASLAEQLVAGVFVSPLSVSGTVGRYTDVLVYIPLCPKESGHTMLACGGSGFVFGTIYIYVPLSYSLDSLSHSWLFLSPAQFPD